MKRIPYPMVLKGPNGTYTPLISAILFIATATVALAAWQSESQPHSSTPAPQHRDLAAAPTYANWLKEDVVYIIAKEELAAFERLTTDKAREQFVEQFWLRRDPTPGTPENEFKEEHYRRIAYANEHFAGSNAGWKTDRGRIYIQWGPPDEIESHPAGGTFDKGARVMPPFEEWRYRYVEGIGEKVNIRFVDRARTGDYQMEPRNPQ